MIMISPACSAAGPLRVHPANPRYFADSSGAAVFLCGSHNWANFVDLGLAGAPPFDYDAYLDFMAEHGFNFMRFWTWEHAAWATWTADKLIIAPMPYRRTGPGLANDGLPKFDLEQFDDAYFERMRRRLIAARDRGIYAAFMLFQAFSGMWLSGAGHPHDPFRGHYFNRQNNIQAFDGDRNNDSVVDIDDPDVRAYQESYIRKVVETVNDLDNVLFEVINEGGNPRWQEFVVDAVHRCEASLPARHPVGITGHGGVDLAGMLASACEWISPGKGDGAGFEDVGDDPPAWDGPKVSVLDTDHIWGHGISCKWVWKSFLRGHNLLFMDTWQPLASWPNAAANRSDAPGYVDGRGAMKAAAACARRCDLARMAPRGDLASTGFCLADPGRRYLVYAPDEAEIVVDLSAAVEPLHTSWIHPTTGTIERSADAAPGGARRFRSPLHSDSVLELAVAAG